MAVLAGRVPVAFRTEWCCPRRHPDARGERTSYLSQPPPMGLHFRRLGVTKGYPGTRCQSAWPVWARLPLSPPAWDDRARPAEGGLRRRGRRRAGAAWLARACRVALVPYYS
ncbi:hypothetical protein P7K49_000666 [Saguinus oedipus]|uniref:Uncharacterized protein n=1 Tax=Saguinus oedipus TaxID=9490 RepID=A0ABQ9WCW7_SAGOE|nr:hypothetical protein P7K49_000666 [Saguinus oedipus]